MAGERRDYQVRFARVGLVHRPPVVLLKGLDLSRESERDRAAAELFEQCKPWMTGARFTVTIDFTTGQVWVNGGDDGRGRLEVMS